MDLTNSIKPILISAGIGGRYVAGIDRLERSLMYEGWAGDMRFWRNEYPFGSAEHGGDGQYNFKVHAFNEQFLVGKKVVVWADASFWCVKNPMPLFDYVNDNGIYFFDDILRKIQLIVGDKLPLSEIKGIHSWVNLLDRGVFLRKENGGDNPIRNKGFLIGRDTINDEVIFTAVSSGIYRLPETNADFFIDELIYIESIDSYRIMTTDIVTNSNLVAAILQLIQFSDPVEETITNESIVFDELQQSFSSTYSWTPSIYIENGDTLITPDGANREVLYTHNIGNWGEFYDVVQECSITLVLNKEADINKVLRNLEYNSIVRDNNKVVDRTKTITAVRIQTQNQDTGKIPFSTTRIKRKFDKWRVKIPRDISTRSRLRSTHFIVTLYYDNSENKEFIMNRLISYYDIQQF